MKLKATVTSALLAAGVVGLSAAQGQAPAVVTGRRFRGWVSRGYGPGRTKLEELTLRPIGGRQVVVRTEASRCSNAKALSADFTART